MDYTAQWNAILDYLREHDDMAIITLRGAQLIDLQPYRKPDAERLWRVLMAMADRGMAQVTLDGYPIAKAIHERNLNLLEDRYEIKRG